ncbi:MAG: NAD(P)-dependent oxidoreductase [Roseobacter sp. MedPE-SW]|nr:MAG: NAD(P)-dependent oxidoreductase [Roseobacter sp. MedPE-SW]
MTKYLVTGATGQLGQLVLSALSEKNIPTSDIAVLVRREVAAAELKSKGYDVRMGDYSDTDKLVSAFAGIERLLLISGSEVGQRLPQHLNVVTSAKAAGVKFIAYTSLLKARSSKIGLAPEHVGTEEAIAASGLDYTFLRNGWYAENYLMALPQILELGQHFGAAGDAKFAPATRADLADAAAVVLSSEGHEGKTYELAGDDSFTYADYVGTIAELSGKEITYVDMPEAAFKDALTGAGLPEPLAALLSNADAVSKDGWLFDDSKTLSGLIGHPTTPIKDVLKAAMAS